MKHFLLITLIVVLPSLFSVAQPNFVRVKVIRPADSAAASVSGVFLDRYNHIYTAGTFADSIWLDSIQFKTRLNFYEPFIAKYDSNFKLIWATSPAGPRGAYSMTGDDNSNTYITGWMGRYAVFGEDTVWGRERRNTYLAKYDPDGHLLWARSDGGDGDDIGYGVTTDHAGNVYLTGSFSATATFGSDSVTSRGGDDIFIAKYDSNGTPLWVRSAGGAVSDVGWTTAVDSDGNVYITGYFEGTAVFGSDTVESSLPSIYNVFIAKYDRAGNYQWMLQPGGAVVAKGREITVDTAGNVYVTGHFEGTAIFGEDTLVTQEIRDIFVVKINAEGRVQWARSGGGRGQDGGYGIAVDSLGNVFVTGVVDIFPVIFGSDTLRSGGYDMFLAKYSSDGMLRWLKAAGGPGQEGGGSIAFSKTGSIYVGGIFGQVARFDSLVLYGALGSGSSAFIAELREPPVASSVSATPREDRGVSVYPNPSHGTFSLRLNNHTQGDAIITITDLLGRTIYRQMYGRESLQSAISVRLEGLAVGMYVVRVMSGGAVFSERLMIE